MSLRSRVFAAMYDGQMRRAEKAGLTDMRKALVAQAAGAVLEIGAGTGANLGHYPPAVTSLTVTEPDVFMLKRLERRATAEAPSTMVLRAPAEDLPFEDDDLRRGRLHPGALRRRRPAPCRTRDPPRPCVPEADSSSSSTCGPPTPAQRRSRTG